MIKILLFLAIPVVIIALVIVALHAKSAEQMGQKGSNGSTSGQTVNQPQTNPLIRNAELQRVQDNYKTKYQQLRITPAPQPKYNFQYQLSPQLQNKGSFLPFHFDVVHAASNCNIDSAPGKLPVYTLKAHIKATDATALASSFGINATPSSLLMDDGKSFQYYYTSTDVTHYFTLAEPSGVYMYHEAYQTPPPSTISATQAQTIAKTAATNHNLASDTKVTNTTTSASGLYTFRFTKQYGGLNIIDAHSLKTLAPATSVCAAPASENMGFVDVWLTHPGDVVKIINNTREVISSAVVSRESLEKSLAEYEAAPLTPPIVSDGSVTTGKVTINEAQLVYYDYGNEYGQTEYVPVYATSGTTANNARVITLFPAVSIAELKKAGVMPGTTSAGIVQMNTFDLPQPQPPSFSTNPPGGSCPGGLIDYTVNCSYSDGTPLCSAMGSQPSGSDPFNVCSSGCKRLAGTISIKPGEDACQKFLNSGSSGGDISCTVDACPC